MNPMKPSQNIIFKWIKYTKKVTNKINDNVIKCYNNDEICLNKLFF